ncbi:PREDICTED: la-related protein 6C [Tarenaya hassleriana]|uniref:la-related protein 6C n=1 Tax=Tarenaya hassleriana TaxID=28532 RepID=UPI00053C664D|nr:PREDICTED: la-related protein 6C [Tarenaya hassleriana]
MAQLKKETESAMKETTKSFYGGGGGGDSPAKATAFKFNAQAPEFVPRSHMPAAAQVPVSGYFCPFFQYLGGGGAPDSDWVFVGDLSQHHLQDPAAFYVSNPAVNPNPSSSSKNSPLLSDDLRLKIVKQVEYQFTDISVLANESISKHISKDPEGYVPISYIASTKKIKALTSNHHMVSIALRSSSKLILSEDGKKVKRRSPFTEKNREDLQSRTVVAENLPDDHSYQNLEKIFGVVGAVKAIRICHPQEFNSPRSKGDFLMSNKIHALIEYDNTDIAEKAVEKLNDERNWRKGLRVRLLLRCSPKSVLKSRRLDFNEILDDDDGTPTYESGEESSQNNPSDSLLESDKNRAKGRGRGRGRIQTSYGSGRGIGLGLGLMSPTSQSSNGVFHHESSPKSASKGPRMPDGTRGFTMGRGKPFSPSGFI